MIDLDTIKHSEFIKFYLVYLDDYRCLGLESLYLMSYSNVKLNLKILYRIKTPVILILSQTSLPVSKSRDFGLDLSLAAYLLSLGCA